MDSLSPSRGDTGLLSLANPELDGLSLPPYPATGGIFDESRKLQCARADEFWRVTGNGVVDMRPRMAPRFPA